MKKLFVIACALMISACTFAQSSTVTDMKNLTYPLTGTVDTVTNTGTGAVYISMTESYSNITIQPKVTRLSGTMDSNSKPQLYGSIDGTNYYALTGDTLHISNTASPIVTNWEKTQQGYKYYKVQWTGTGTMSAKLEAKIFLVK